MPEQIVAIYGYEFVREFTVAGIDFVPLFQHPECGQRAKDPESFQLTGYGRFQAPAEDEWSDAEKVHLLTAGMTFIQQQHVEASMLIRISTGDTVESLIQTEAFRNPLLSPTPRHTSGDLILSDTWRPESRVLLLRTFYQRFEVERPADALRQAFFRHIEISRLATPYVEIHHFLAFSALELLARSRGSYETQRNAAVPISNMLNDLDFPIEQVEVERWTHARNEAFHNGRLSSPDPRGGADIKLADQLYPITSVLGDVLLKLLPFDDGHINWNRWRDRMAFR
jgi:hypothetical protein